MLHNRYSAAASALRGPNEAVRAALKELEDIETAVGGGAVQRIQRSACVARARVCGCVFCWLAGLADHGTFRLCAQVPMVRAPSHTSASYCLPHRTACSKHRPTAHQSPGARVRARGSGGAGLCLPAEPRHDTRAAVTRERAHMCSCCGALLVRLHHRHTFPPPPLTHASPPPTHTHAHTHTHTPQLLPFCGAWTARILHQLLTSGTCEPLERYRAGQVGWVGACVAPTLHP
jgi:hypothetical protein